MWMFLVRVSVFWCFEKQGFSLKLSLFAVRFVLSSSAGWLHVVPPVNAGWRSLDRLEGKCEREMEEGGVGGIKWQSKRERERMSAGKCLFLFPAVNARSRRTSAAAAGAAGCHAAGSRLRRNGRGQMEGKVW